EQKEEEQREREPSIPGPPGAPDRLRPNRTGRQHHRREGNADLRRRRGEAVEPGILQPQIKPPCQSNQGKGEERAPGRWNVQEKNFAGGSLPRLNRGKGKRQDNGDRDSQEGDTADDDSTTDDYSGAIEHHRGGSARKGGHSSTTKAKARAASVTNTTS